MSESLYIFSIIAVISLVTVVLRFAPFIVFRQGAPKAVLYLGRVLPQAIMAMLVVYCLRNTSFTGGSYAIPEIISLAAVIVLHKLRHNTLLSIIAGTLIYMLCVQVIFV